MLFQVHGPLGISGDVSCKGEGGGEARGPLLRIGDLQVCKVLGRWVNDLSGIARGEADPTVRRGHPLIPFRLCGSCTFHPVGVECNRDRLLACLAPVIGAVPHHEDLESRQFHLIIVPFVFHVLGQLAFLLQLIGARRLKVMWRLTGSFEFLGVWVKQNLYQFGVRASGSTDSNASRTEKAKKDKYVDASRACHRSFTPLMFSVDAL